MDGSVAAAAVHGGGRGELLPGPPVTPVTPAPCHMSQVGPAGAARRGNTALNAAPFADTSSPLILQLILLNCSPRWVPLTTTLFQYLVLSLQCHLGILLSGGASGIMPPRNGRT